jgi:glycosyltransferase involved in cell wall biosynthesis
MGDSLRVSVVTPSYNQAAFLEQTMLSVLDQGYLNLEYLVVDGGSADGSVEIIQKYAPRLAYWVSERDRGQADAINKGLARVSGDIVAWLNSDDYYLPGAIRSVVRAFEDHPEAGLIYGDVAAVDGENRPLNTIRYGNYGLEGLLRFNIIGQPSVFMRRSVQVRAGMLDPTFHYQLDHHLWLRMALLSDTWYVPEPWSAARFHAEAKNIAQAAAFGQEAYRIIAWMQTQPELAEAFRQNRRRIQAGADRFNGWYLSEGGQPLASLKSYGRSFANHPPTALQDWKRILVTFVELFGVHQLRKLYLRRRLKQGMKG